MIDIDKYRKEFIRKGALVSDVDKVFNLIEQLQAQNGDLQAEIKLNKDLVKAANIVIKGYEDEVQENKAEIEQLKKKLSNLDVLLRVEDLEHLHKMDESEIKELENDILLRDKKIEQLKKDKEWISVDDRLPTHLVDVIFMIKFDNTKWFPCTGWCKYYDNGDILIVTPTNQGTKNRQVSKWKPISLPKPPEGD